jgi:hypothetical protein
MSPSVLARELTAVGGAALALMGAGLALGARRHAADHRQWDRDRRHAAGLDPALRAEDDGLARVYRAGGALLAAAGIVLAAAAFAGRAAMRLELDRGDALVGGALLALAGAAGAAARAWSRPLSPTRAERASEACGWALSVLLVSYGVRLLKTGLP